MSKYLKTTGTFIGVWCIASLLNGLLCGISLAVLASHSTNQGAGMIALSFVLSFICSAPLVGIVWFVTIMAQLARKKGHELFQLILSTALFCSIAGALLFIYTLGTEFMNARFVAGLCIIISALASVLFFRKQIKTNE